MFHGDSCVVRCTLSTLGRVVRECIIFSRVKSPAESPDQNVRWDEATASSSDAWRVPWVCAGGRDVTPPTVPRFVAKFVPEAEKCLINAKSSLDLLYDAISTA
jgi:hypothetical protein